MDTNELVTVMERGFARVDTRIDALANEVRKLGFELDEIPPALQRLAEAIDNTNEGLKRHREETAQGFDDVRQEIRAHITPLERRVAALEKRGR